MSRLKKMAFEPIDSEEKEILESLENGDWKPVKNLEKEKEEAVKAARNTLEKSVETRKE
jgi:hypothetical protein